MKTIHKYPVPSDNTTCEILMPKGAVILHGDHQDSTGFCVWAEVNKHVSGVDTRSVRFVGTGWDIPMDARHINSFLMSEGRLVFQVYEVTK